MPDLYKFIPKNCKPQRPLLVLWARRIVTARAALDGRAILAGLVATTSDAQNHRRVGGRAWLRRPGSRAWQCFGKPVHLLPQSQIQANKIIIQSRMQFVTSQTKRTLTMMRTRDYIPPLWGYDGEMAEAAIIRRPTGPTLGYRAPHPQDRRLPATPPSASLGAGAALGEAFAFALPLDLALGFGAGGAGGAGVVAFETAVA